MNKKIIIFVLLLLVASVSFLVVMRAKDAEKISVPANDVVVLPKTQTDASNTNPTTVQKTMPTVTNNPKYKTALLGDGCFWCSEHDMEDVNGVIDAVSGYAGGSTENPTYENYVAGGHREVILVTYNPEKVSFANLVEHIIKHGDPTDANGSFHDRGAQYAPAIYYETESEKADARKVIDAIDALKVFEKPLPLIIIPRVKFWPAEEYHQDYGMKNPIRYGYYRNGSGRDAFIKKFWGENSNLFTVTTPH